MKANELRRAFTDYFLERDHLEIPSASLIPHDDSLLFVNSGMVPFKPYFLGDRSRRGQSGHGAEVCAGRGQAQRSR